MNQLTIINHGGVDAIDSRLVADAVEKRHDHLMRDIAGYVSAITSADDAEFTAPRFGVSDFFIPSEYQDSTGRTLPCYLLTKKGCDMVANKMTGKKGVLFTAAYVTAFENMREHIKQVSAPKSAMDMLRLQSAALFELEDKVNLIEDKLDNQMTIDHGQQRTIQQAVAKRVYERAAEIYPPAEVKVNAAKLFQAAYRDIKTRFGVASYRDIRPVDYKNAIASVESWIEPATLRAMD